MDYSSSRSLRTTPSQETLISLMQLEPLPMADTEKDLPALPEDDPRGRPQLEVEVDTSRAREDDFARPQWEQPWLDLLPYGGHHPSPLPPLRKETQRLTLPPVTRIQRYSTYALSAFTAIHLANTSIIPLITCSVPASESYLLLAREIYQTPLTEPLFVALPIAAHIAAGLALRFVRRQQNLARYGGATPAVFPQKSATMSTTSSHTQRSVWPAVSYISLSGYGFAAALGAHVAANRLLPLYVEGDSSNIGLAYVAHGFARHPVAAGAAYAALLGLACGHMVWGLAKWIGLAQRAGWTADLKSVGSTNHREEDGRRRKVRRRIWLWVNGTAAMVTLVWAAGGLGIVARGGRMEGWVGKVYDELFDFAGL